MLNNEWPNGNNEKEYDPIMGAPGPIVCFDEEISDPLWHKGCEELLKWMKDHGGFHIWSVTPTRTDKLHDDSVEVSRTSEAVGTDPVPDSRKT